MKAAISQPDLEALILTEVRRALPNVKSVSVEPVRELGAGTSMHFTQARKTRFPFGSR